MRPREKRVVKSPRPHSTYRRTWLPHKVSVRMLVQALRFSIHLIPARLEPAKVS